MVLILKRLDLGEVEGSGSPSGAVEGVGINSNSRGELDVRDCN